ncbi:MAG: helix-turn-helix transcriptional regulator [Actinomycetota bacterium]|nr:helix-turn-helix transcriptional regulator [Actinomycetota bacterium]MDH5278904.1 helix-turn-helix transcriptional regulator [Actinomycetota bacterium]
MTRGKTYGQFCGLARALDHVGDRWTLLIVRELLLGPRTFAALQASLDGISPNLLVDRLRSLASDGIVRRNGAPARSKAVEYRLTDDGAALEPAVLALIRWGARWMTTGPGDDHVEPTWTVLALRALLNGTPAERSVHGNVHLVVDDQAITVAVTRGRRTVRAGHQGPADATVTETMSTVLAVASGLLTLDNNVITGDDELAHAALQTTQGASTG